MHLHFFGAFFNTSFNLGSKPAERHESESTKKVKESHLDRQFLKKYIQRPHRHPHRHQKPQQLHQLQPCPGGGRKAQAEGGKKESPGCRPKTRHPEVTGVDEVVEVVDDDVDVSVIIFSFS